MEPVILIDTHVAVWLYAGARERLSGRASQLLETSEVAISPAAELELAYLHEVGRVSVAAPAIIGDLAGRIGLRVEQISFAHVCAHAVALSWTRDPFDRLQAAHALARGIPLLTKDRRMLANLSLAVWE